MLFTESTTSYMNILTLICELAAEISSGSPAPGVAEGCGAPAGKIGAAGDQAGAALVGEIGPRPLDENQHAVLEADQEKNVDEQPGQPGYETGDVNLAELRRLRRRGRWWPGCLCRSSGKCGRRIGASRTRMAELLDLGELAWRHSGLLGWRRARRRAAACRMRLSGRRGLR